MENIDRQKQIFTAGLAGDQDRAIGNLREYQPRFGFEFAIPSNGESGSFHSETPRALVGDDVIPNGVMHGFSGNRQFESDVADEAKTRAARDGDALISAHFTFPRPSGTKVTRAKYSSPRNSTTTDVRDRLEPGATDMSEAADKGDQHHHEPTSASPLPRVKDDANPNPQAADVRRGGAPARADRAGEPQAGGDVVVSARLASVPPVRAADVHPLAAAYGVRELPQALAALAQPTADVVIDVAAAEREAAALVHPDAPPELLARIVNSRAEGTYSVYSYEMTQWARFAASIGARGAPAEPAATARYVFALADAGKTYARITRVLDAVSASHALIGVASPTGDRLVSEALAVVGRKKGRKQVKKELPFRPTELRAALTYLDAIQRMQPERASLILALLSLGIATGLRRAELVALDTDDVEVTGRGMRIRVGKTKTRSKADPPSYIDVARTFDMRICPVVAMRRYAQVCRLTQGPLFRAVLPDGTLKRSRIAGSTVHAMIREVVERAGIGDPKRFGSHSLRGGMINAAYEAGLSYEEIAVTSLHDDPDSTYGYLQPQPFARATTSRVFA